MATAPNQQPADEIYGDLFADLDAMLAENAPEVTDDTELDAALATVAATPAVYVSPAVDTGTSPTASTTQTAPTPSTATAVDSQIENIVRTQLEKQQLEAKLAATSAELEALRGAKPTDQAPDFFDSIDADSMQLTQEEMEVYKDNIPTLNKLIKGAVTAQLKAYDSARVKSILDDAASIRDRLSQVDNTVNTTSVEAFGLAVNTAMPDLGTKMRTSEWNAFMKEKAPFSAGAATMQDLWNYAESQRNISAMHEIASYLKLATDPVAGMVAPGSSRAPAHVPSATQKRVPYSSYTKAMERQQNGEITYDAFIAFQNKFFQAEAAGLVDENA